MCKKLAMLSIIVVLCIVGLGFVGGCDKEKTAAIQQDNAVCQKEIQKVCTKTLDSSQKGTCGSKVDQTCPPDCKMECCAAKQKSGDCPLKSIKTSCPAVCPKKSETL